MMFAIAAIKMLMVLFCSKLCHSFTLIPDTSIINTQVVSRPIYNTKDSDDGQEGDAFEWDGVVVEGAHDSEFESVDNSVNDNFMPSISFMSMANSVTSPALTAAAVGTTTTTSAAADFDPLKNAGILHQLAMEKEQVMSEDDLLDMGGDPAFLDDPDEDGDALLKEGMDDADFFGWDGTVDEDAHLDF